MVTDPVRAWRHHIPTMSWQPYSCHIPFQSYAGWCLSPYSVVANSSLLVYLTETYFLWSSLKLQPLSHTGWPRVLLSQQMGKNFFKVSREHCTFLCHHQHIQSVELLVCGQRCQVLVLVATLMGILHFFTASAHNLLQRRWRAVFLWLRALPLCCAQTPRTEVADCGTVPRPGKSRGNYVYASRRNIGSCLLPRQFSGVYLPRCFPTLGAQMYLNYNSHHLWQLGELTGDDGSCSPTTSGDPRLKNTDSCSAKFL